MAQVGYRRMSGAIGVSESEKGSRGLWWEKRRALLAWLVARGHQVHFASRLTKPSQSQVDAYSGRGDGFLGRGYKLNEHSGPVDVLMVEFGSSNAKFYGKDLEETQRMVSGHKGPLVFLCDDPDLPYPWKTVPASKARQWRCWYNAARAVPFGGQPSEVPISDFPFSSLQDPAPGDPLAQLSYLVYIGRPGGREKQVAGLIAGRVPFRVFGKQGEWERLGVRAYPPPDQPGRAAFYGAQLGCLVLADAKHKRLGWRTGRAYHAALAGCPPVVERDHAALAERMSFFERPSDLVSLARAWASGSGARGQSLLMAQRSIFRERALCGAAAAELGL